jgi:hypothetical protein
MTTEDVTEGARERATTRRGLSRRDMIRASAVAGIGAWTAPVIIDSLASPAAAGSVKCQGNKYYAKLVGRGTGAGPSYHPGNCYYAAPLCNSGTKVHTGGNSPDSSTCSQNDNYTWVCTSANPPGNHTGPFPTLTDSNPGQPGVGTYTVVLSAGCSFDPGSGIGQTTYAAVGNYDWQGSGGTCVVVAPNTSNSVIFQKTLSGQVLDYMYLEFVCS